MTAATAPARTVAALTPPVVEYPDDGSVRPVGRFTWVPVETPLPAAGPSPRLAGRSIAVVGGSDGTAGAVVAGLAEAGGHAHRLPAPGLERPERVTEAVARFRAAIGPLDGIVDLNVEDPLDATGESGWEPAWQQTIALLQSCYPEWVGEGDAGRLFYLAVTRMGGQMGHPRSRMSQPLGGIWAGLAKGLPREIPNCNVRVLDLSGEQSPPAAPLTASLVRQELYRWGEFEVGYREGRRYTLVAQARQVGPPALALRTGDVVVMSGGGRGIGFALARALAGNFGCRVIVSGRAPRPDVGAPVLAMAADEFRHYRDGLLREAAAGRRLPQVRAEVDRLVQARELWANLSTARAEGLPIEYFQCDVTEREQVDRLLDRAGDRLVGVVHNAGVDIPARLVGKAPEVVARVVRVKVQGFFNLFHAVEGRSGLAFFSNVGSLTGRVGGMAGGLDYGAANEGLSRLGMWASQPDAQPGRRHRVPVTTVCWPTWKRLGMITNYEAAVRYMSAIDVAEGLYRWQREILAGGGGEVTFMGDVGPAMQPAVLRGYPQDSGLPGIERLVSSRFYLGEPREFQPYESISSGNVIDADATPCCHDFRLDGEPALPVSLCLEYLLSVGDWVAPEGRDQPAITEVRGVEVDLATLRADPTTGTISLVKHGRGRWHDGAWLVSALLRRQDDVLARAELVYRAGDALLGRGPSVASATASTPAGFVPVEPVAVAGRLHWRGHVFRLASWRRHPETGQRFAQVDADRMQDLMGVSPAPRSRLPLNQVENIVRAAYQRRGGDGASPGGPRRLTIDRLWSRPAGDTRGRLLGDAECGAWQAHDQAGRLRLQVDGLRLR